MRFIISLYYPPWYHTWWAYLLYAIIAICNIYMLIRYRTKQLHEKHRELEKTVSERTAELSQRVEELAVINSVQEAWSVHWISGYL